MDVKFSISQAARFLGVTTDAIRLYEKEGLITPLRDANNGYRYYDCNQLARLMFISLYRRIDISIPELRKLLSNSTFSDVHNTFSEHISAYQKKIEELQNKISKLSAMSRAIDKLETDFNSIHIETMQKGYRMIDTLDPDTEYHRISAVTTAQYFSYGTISYKLCFDASGITQSYMSFIIWEDMINYAPLDRSISELPVLESRECVTTVVTGHDNGKINLDISKLTDYCHENELTHFGYYYAHYMYSLSHAGDIVDYYRIYMPIKK